MSERLSGEMPADLVRHLAGGRVVVVATVDDKGWPYTMIMNWAVARDPRTLRLSLDRRTQTLRNVRANGRVMLEVLGDGLVYGVRGDARVIQEEMRHAPVPSAMVEVRVDLVKRDLIPGVEFRGPSFSWGTLEPVMAPADDLGIRELHAYEPPGPCGLTVAPAARIPSMPSWVVSEDVLSTLVIRKATVDDLPRIVELLQQESLGDERREDPGPPLPQRYYDAFAEIEADPNNDVIVAEIAGRVVGMFQLTVFRNMQRGGVRVAEVESVVVDSPLRGRRIGEAMMRWAIDDARRRGCFRLQLTSNKQRLDAHRFYQRLGFVASHEGMKLTL